MKALRTVVLCLCIGVTAACGSSSPAAPTGASAAGALAPPELSSPADGAQLTTLRPVLVLKNVAATQSAARVYEFVVSDRSDFAPSPAGAGGYAATVHQTGVAEGTGGTTSFTPDVDLQPTTRMYWKARVLQGGVVSDWSAARSFNTAVGGYSRPGELYDPLVNGSTVGMPVGAATFIPGKGIKLNDGKAYVRYQLAQPLSSGEFSMEIEGLAPNGPGPKLKVFSMMDGVGDLYRSSYLMNAQYRGSSGNPDNSISWKMLLGDPALKLEPDFGSRLVIGLDPSHAYFWKGTWSNGFNLVVKDGVNGPTLYDYGQTLDGASYNPNPHFAYLGANNAQYGEEDGSFPGAIYRNVWIGRGSRPQSLGTALLPR